MRGLRFAVPAVLCVGLVLGISGCGGKSRQPRTRAQTLTIYTSLPFEGPYAADARSVYDAEQLALAQAGGVVAGYRVVLRRLDDTSPATGQVDPALVQDNARAAAGDSSTIAYIGELIPGSSADSIPILGAAGILQVSPGDTAMGLTGATFARVVPPDTDEAMAQLAAMHGLGVRRLYLLADRSTYGRDVARTVAGGAAGEGITLLDPSWSHIGGDARALIRAIERSKADALLYAGGPGDRVAALWNALSAENHTIRKFASAAITDASSWAQTTAAAEAQTYLSAPGLPRGSLPRAGSQFVADLLGTYGDRVQWSSAIFGYVAMTGVLDDLYGLGARARYPDAVVDAFLRAADVPSALGPYSMQGGQTTFDGYVFMRPQKDGVSVAFTPGPG